MRALMLPLFALPAALVALPAAAQDAPAPAQTAPAPAAPGSVTDAEIGQFADSIVAVERINADTSIAAADKQARMQAAVTATGLSAERYNAIAGAAQSDEALKTKIVAAVTAKTQTTAPAQPTPAPAPAE